MARLVSRRERWVAFCAYCLCGYRLHNRSDVRCRKVLIFALVGGGHILDTRVIGAGSVLRTAVIFFYLSNEGISLLENAAHLGLPVPKKLKDVLEQLHKRSEKEDEDED